MFLPATCQESDCSWASFGSFVNCGVIMISSNNLCLLYSDFVTTEGAITSNALRPTYVTQKGSPSRTPGGGDARVYTTPNIRVFPNMGLCRQRFSAIDGIQVIARFFFSSVCMQSYGESRFPAELAQYQLVKVATGRPSPGLAGPACWFPRAGCLLLLAEGPQLCKCPTEYRSSTVCGAGVVLWKETANRVRISVLPLSVALNGTATLLR